MRDLTIAEKATLADSFAAAWKIPEFREIPMDESAEVLAEHSFDYCRLNRRQEDWKPSGNKAFLAPNDYDGQRSIIGGAIVALNGDDRGEIRDVFQSCACKRG